jgi:hypothetical protein
MIPLAGLALDKKPMICKIHIPVLHGNNAGMWYIYLKYFWVCLFWAEFDKQTFL